VLDALSEAGYIKVIPGRPKQYQPHDPESLVERAIMNKQDSYEQFKREATRVADEFVESYSPVRNREIDELSPTEDLFYVVDVGEPSEQETRRLFREADEEIFVLTKSFGYIDAIEPAMRSAIDAGVSVDVLMLAPDHLTSENRQEQEEIRSFLTDRFPSVTVRLTDRVLPWRGTFADPDLQYETGQGLLLVEQEEVPNHLRQAAVTENPAFVAGLWQYFDLLWHHESEPANNPE
jgi:sugar-specific transcriptional regulator TrmB